MMPSDVSKPRDFKASSASTKPSKTSCSPPDPHRSSKDSNRMTAQDDSTSQSSIGSTDESVLHEREEENRDEAQQRQRLEKIPSGQSYRESIRQASRMLSGAGDQFEPTRKVTTRDSTGKTIISFNYDDPDNPDNWPIVSIIDCLTTSGWDSTAPSFHSQSHLLRPSVNCQ
jgi:hypothetical protein